MTIAYLIDTDWVIPFLNGHPAIVERLEERQEQGLALSVISLAELYEGIYYSRDPDWNEQALNNFPRGVTVVGVDEDICRLFGRERGRLRAAGQMIGDCDLLIGATALHHHLTFLTNNRRHFELIEGLKLVSL
jgi:tRNA(fMet)-specific endonuclease VapC